MRAYDDPRPPLSRATLVVGVYGALALGALVLGAGRGDPDVYRLREAAPVWLLVSPLAGLAIGVAVAAATRAATARWRWMRDLYQSFRDLLGPLTTREVTILAAASAIGEELLFRGALQAWLGVVPQALMFALLHIGPGRRFLPWTASALVLGIGLGYLAEATGNLGGPIVAHFMINFLNLRFITGKYKPATW